MLQHIDQQNDVETGRRQRQRHRRKVSNKDNLAEPPGFFGGIGSQFDSSYATALRRNTFRQGPATASDFKDAVTLLKVPKRAHVSSVGNRIEGIIVGREITCFEEVRPPALRLSHRAPRSGLRGTRPAPRAPSPSLPDPGL